MGNTPGWTADARFRRESNTFNLKDYNGNPPETITKFQEFT